MNNLTSLRIAEQCSLHLPFPRVYGNQDYRDLKNILDRIDKVLLASGVERNLQEEVLREAQEEALRDRDKQLSPKERLKIQGQTSVALRCNIARILFGEAFRPFSIRLADSHLLGEFCRLVNFDRVWAPSKSTLQEFSEFFSESQIRMVSEVLMRELSDSYGSQAMGLKEALDMSVALMDSTCLELNIHFPVDWVLLRDAVRTLSKSIDCIRRHGLKHRMRAPKEFLKRINQLSIAMTQAKKGENARKKRKGILRLMKKLCKCVQGHAKRYRALLIEKREELTDLSEKQAAQIIRRIDNVLSQLPEAIDQAHERIIGGRLLDNEDKLLSLYEPQTQVYHRGKVSKATEFGLQCHLAESMDGFIMDWDLVQGPPKKDSQHLKPCIQRLQKAGIHIKDAVGDRGYPSRENSLYLKKNEIQNHLCPKNVIKLQEKLKEKVFAKFQKRRAQTEARIGILKHNFIGRKMPMKGMERQAKHTALCVLTHNLWLAARIILIHKKSLEDAA